MTVPAEDTANKVLPQAQPEAVQPVQADATAQPISEKEPIEDPNWRAFREARKKDRQEKEAAEKLAREKSAEAEALKAAMEAAFGNKQESDRNRSDNRNSGYAYEPEESEDERIEKKVQAVLAAREQAMDNERRQREQQEYPQRLNQTYSDFNNTVSSENLDYLEYHYPEVASPLRRLPDGYEKWADIYKAVKKFVPNSVNARQDSARADANFNKPKSISSATVTNSGEPGNASRLSDDRKAENWARMQKLLKGVG